MSSSRFGYKTSLATTSIHTDRIVSVHVEPSVVSDHHATIGLFTVDSTSSVHSNPVRSTRIIRPIDDIILKGPLVHFVAE